MPNSSFYSASALGLSLLFFSLPGGASEREDAHDRYLRQLRSQQSPIAMEDRSKRPLHQKVARQFAPAFGLSTPDQQLTLLRQRQGEHQTVLRFQQHQQGLPVFAGELVAALNPQQQLTTMSGEVTHATVFNTQPGVSAYDAQLSARLAVARWYGLEGDQLQVDTAQLMLFDPGLLSDTRSSAQLVWKMNVSPSYLSAINELVLIDAQLNGVILHFNQTDTALNRETYDAANVFALPGTLLCTEVMNPLCTGVDQDATNVHNFVEDTFDYYAVTHGRDGIDDNGSPVRGSVNFPVQNNQPNAAWIGSAPYLGQSNIMIFTDDLTADDVVAHEYTHGVTENESGLLYYSESGAINESLSDIWGELVDLANGAGTDTALTRWQIGEDAGATGVIRDMQDPPLYGDPDRMTSPRFVTDTSDNGGVHSNSGVNNKAAYLMADGSAGEPGGTFNGQTVAGMGTIKTAKLYYQAQTTYLTSGSDYLDLYNALLASCTDLVNLGELTAADCSNTVLPAITAVEMDQSPSVDYAPNATTCPVGIHVYDLFADNFELNNLANWTPKVTTGVNVWQTSNINLGSNNGNYNLIGRGYAVNVSNGLDNDSSLQTNTDIRVPQSLTAYIYFDHAYYFEAEGAFNYDGGVIEYSTNQGASWQDAGILIDDGRTYTGALSPYNPAAARDAFVQYSHGFNSTRVNLSSLAGQFIRFRFRSLADELVASGPWTIDNFRFYVCADNAPPVPNAGADQSITGSVPVQLSGTLSDPDGDSLSYSWNQISGTPVTLNNASTLTPDFVAPQRDDTLIFELSVTDGTYTEVDTVNVSVRYFFSAANGGGGGGGCSLNEKGRFDPLWILLLTALSLLHIGLQWRRTKAVCRTHERVIIE